MFWEIFNQKGEQTVVDFVPRRLEGRPQLGQTSVGLCARLGLQDRKDGVVEPIQIGRIEWPLTGIREIREIRLAPRLS